MVYVILGISLTLNIIFIIVAYFYLKYKVLGIKKLKEDLQSKFVNEDEFDLMLDSL